MQERPNLKDGLWHAQRPGTATPVRIRTNPRNISYTVVQTHRSYLGRVVRWDGTKWLYESSCRWVYESWDGKKQVLWRHRSTT